MILNYFLFHRGPVLLPPNTHLEDCFMTKDFSVWYRPTPTQPNVGKSFLYRNINEAPENIPSRR